MTRNVRLTVAVLIGVVSLAACGSSGGSKSGSSGEADTSSTTRPEATSSTSAPGAEPTLQLVDTTSLGKVVAGADGKVLYLYQPDGTAEVSTVPAGILQAWPPVVAKTAPTVGTGLEQSKVSAAAQPSGVKWVRYNGHLLYGFTGDASPGDTNGNGILGVWHAVNASGDAVAS